MKALQQQQQRQQQKLSGWRTSANMQALTKSSGDPTEEPGRYRSSSSSSMKHQQPNRAGISLGPSS